MAIKSLKAFGWFAGIWLIALGVSRMAFSTHAIPGGGTVNPTVDSESRAAGALLIGVGAGYLWAFRQSPIPSTAVRLLSATMALLGLSRLISMADVGMPHPVFIAATAVGFAAAGLTYWYLRLGESRAPQ